MAIGTALSFGQIRGVVRWLLRQASSAFWGTALIVLLVFLASAVSDEGAVAFRDRMGRVLPTLPLASCLGVYLAIRRAKARGELRVLSLLGVHPWVKDTAFGVGAVVPSLAAAVWLLRGGPIEGFFPPSPATVEFRALPNGEGYQSERIGLRWTHASGLESIPETAQRLASVAREPAAVVVALLAAGLVLFAARTERKEGKGTLSVLFALIIAASTVTAFQLAASGRVGPWWTIVPAAALVASEVAVRMGLRGLTFRT
ncbi:MAG: hypothetical protein U0174_17475 [Polyangiaceae bacterium]